MKATFLKVLYFCTLLLTLPVFAGVNVSIDRSQINLGETVVLTLSMDDQALASQVDTSVLDKDFILLGRTVSSLISMALGEVTQKTNLELSLQARRAGELKIPALSVGKDKTEVLLLTVNQASSTSTAQNDGNPPVIIEALWANTGVPYVQSQLNVVVRIYHVGNLHNAALDEPRPIDTLVKRLGEDVHGMKTKNGVQYQTLERHYALFPQKSGTLTIPAIAMQMRAPVPKDQGQRLFGFDVFNRRMLTIQTAPLTINVMPRPQNSGSSSWLPAEQITLLRSGLPEGEVSVGEAINMQLDLDAIGLNAEQLPQINVVVADQQFSVYPDEPMLKNESDGRVIYGGRKQTFVLIPKQAGALTIPEIELGWWDKHQDKQMKIILPEVALKVLAVAGSEVPAVNPIESDAPANEGLSNIASANQISVVSQQANSRFWKWIALASIAAWLITLAYMFVYLRPHLGGKRADSPTDENRQAKHSLREIKSAVKANSARALWQAMQEYAGARWPSSTPASPQEWASKLSSDEVTAVLLELDAHLFGEASAKQWSARPFETRVLPLLEKYQQRSNTGDNRSETDQLIPALYPE